MNDSEEWIFYSIVRYRKEQQGKCVSTTHTLTPTEFSNISVNLLERYGRFDDVKYENGNVTITIPMYK